MKQPMLLMIHGLMGSLRYFDPQARLPGVVVSAEDLVAYGEHRLETPGRLTLAGQVDHVVAWIEATPVKKLWLLGHSMGGAIAVLAADRRPERIVGLINVEGNFTAKDTFWSRRIAMTPSHIWVEQYRVWRKRPATWLERCGVRPDEQRLAWAEEILHHQSPETVHAMSTAILRETLGPEYLDAVHRLLARGLPLHLVAGAKSAEQWGVPDFVRDTAASYTEQPDTGHLMMLEDPAGFCRIVSVLVTGRPPK